MRVAGESRAGSLAGLKMAWDTARKGDWPGCIITSHTAGVVGPPSRPKLMSLTSAGARMRGGRGGD